MLTTNEMNKKAFILLIIGIVFISTTLRAPLTAVGPIISYIRDGLDISNVLAGFITTIPLLAFAIVSPFVPKIARRLGMEMTLFLAILLLAIGIIIRSLGTPFLLLLGTALIGVAIAFGNVLLPSFIKLKFPLQLGLMTGVFTVSMNLSAGIGAGISYPIADGTSYGWQGALGFWAILAIIACIIWLPQVKKKQEIDVVPSSTNVEKAKSILKSPLTWTITLCMGLQSLIFYTTAAWIPEILQTQGMEAEKSGWMLSIMQFAQLPMTFLIPILAGRFKDQRILVLVFTIFYLIGFTGLLYGDISLTLLWMVALGLGGGASFGLVMMFFSLRSRTPMEAADLSGVAQSFGYLLAAVGPVFFGFIHDATGSWEIPKILFIVTVILLFFAGMHAGRDRFVSEEV
ncbi:MFS transporter, CP family, cyanate transporter [Psychrobacillus psychrotolerans]|uniref:MFS transporter, CP family, cyanate transporter n=1 Tax=Psychrobacillus psychrotolerans TaxID=126156 RepID=A0A1I5W3U1_9BACI|nr:MFS transporter [Psychrobacillus psychrotolerans]SFQ14353.1 MFS transporter, CP family, cyanate transporter [Psychrobacillus psychrotolerans]